MALEDRIRAAEQQRTKGTEHGRSKEQPCPLPRSAAASAISPTITLESKGPGPIDWESMLEHCERWDGMS